MAVVQNTYLRVHAKAYNGMIADTATCDVDTFIADGAGGIGFGVGVKRGTNAGDCAVGVVGAGATPFHATDFLGVTVRDRTRAPDDDDEYADNSHVNVLYRGDIWVTVEDAVALGDAVTVKNSNGVFSATTAAATQAAVPNARWMTAAAANGLALLRLGGAPQV